MKKILLLLFCLFSTPAAADENCNIRLGVSQTRYKPYSWIDAEGHPQGMNIELFEKLAEKSACEYKITVLPWMDLLESFRNGEVDTIASSLSPFAESKKGEPLLQIPINIAFYGNFYTRDTSPPIRNLADLDGKMVVVLDGSVSHDYLKNAKTENGFNIISFPSTEEAVAALSQGTGDVGVFSLTAVINVVEQYGYGNIRLSGSPVFPASYGFLFHEKNEALFKKLNDSMESLKAEGTYFDIVKKWTETTNIAALWIKRFIVLAAVTVFAILAVMLWNKTLRIQVTKKTEDLEKEIVQRKEAERDNLKLREEVMQASKLALLGEMAESVVHEINNPTGLIMHNVSYLHSLQREIRALPHGFKASGEAPAIGGMAWDDAMREMEESYSVINHGLARISETIDELKFYGKNQDNDFQVIDLKECLRLSEGFTQFFVKKYTDHFRVEAPEGDFHVYGNMLHLEQVMINLIQNACFAMGSKEQTITCGLRRVFRRDSSDIELFVSDTGKGMDDETKRNLFTTFFSTRKESGGTGLGLAIVSRIVKEHKGTINVVSKIGEGTTVSIFLASCG